MTTMKDLIRDYGRKIKDMVEEDAYSEEDEADQLDDLMEELKKYFE